VPDRLAERPGEVIDTTATDMSADPIDPWSARDDPDQLGPS